MALFETLVVLLLAAALLSQLARRIGLPYPTVVAVAGTAAAVLPWVPQVGIDPKLAMALFIAPALLSAAFDTSPYELKHNWLPLLALAVFAVLLTTAAVAWLGVTMGGLPIAAAIALGAVVAPPDAAAAQAVLSRLDLPRRTMVILQGESLFNDAIALVLFGAAVAAAGGEDHPLLSGSLLLLEVPGGVLLGLAVGWVYARAGALWSGSQSAVIFEFTGTFLVWMAAERAHVSPVLAVVAYAMLLARSAPQRQHVRDRIHAYSIWDSAVFVLNVIAFLMIGLQARDIVTNLPGPQLWKALGFAVTVLAAVVLVRIVWVMLYPLLLRLLMPGHAPEVHGKTRMRLVVAWSGMRGVLTLATALSLPADFPGRDLIVLCALTVVLGTVVLQGATLGVLIRWLRLPSDTTTAKAIDGAREQIEAAGRDELDRLLADHAHPETLQRVRDWYRSKPAPGEIEAKRALVQAERRELNALHTRGDLPEDAFQILQEELDLRELSLSEPGARSIEEV
ncbi:sodium/proton antiporter, CPA1 family [Pseudoxanthomonas sp. GM95]|uniref:cation:proton antiporter n=1 Tax=Pseudoxanthomonas sp. GM95 TaxID=1881043 RepID=UPI0008B80DFC|nr:cation:proton antiporter [Pseudoxanthomonas sp. GM95]SEM47013.1 sodium/proton antiporter, CPA1 family [Pseudoxanthomonas sp. GM95]